MQKLAATVLLAFASSVCCFAQMTGNAISGTITDAAGAVVQGATVRLVNAQQITIAGVESDVQGRFRFENVEDGSYVIVVTRANFSPRSESVKVAGTDRTDITLVLQINQLNERVTVTADTGLAEDLSKVPVQVNVVSPDALQQRTTSVLAQVAEEETGVSVQRTSPTVGAVLVRGLTEVGVYVDGVRYTNATQRGGINTFFNLNEPTALGSIEIQRSPNTAQFGSDGLGGNVQLLSRQPEYGFSKPRWNSELNTMFNRADNAFAGNALIGYGTKHYGFLTNIVGRRVNTLRPGGGIDSHSAITRFLGLPSNIIGSERLPDTAFTQYGGTFHANATFASGQTMSFRYQRSQQDGGKRYDQLIGGDGNTIAELKNLMLDFGYVRYFKHGIGFFDNFSTTVSYNSQREERINQGGQGNPTAAIINDRERNTTWGVGFYFDKQFKHNSFLIGGDHYHDRVTAPSFSTNPTNGVVRLERPRVPNGSTYDLSGVYVQNVFEAVPNRLRISGAVRYNVGQYKARASDAPLVAGQPLFPNDSARFEDFSGRAGATVTIIDGLNAAFNFSRGFRAPNITALGGLGLVGVGFQVSTPSVLGLGATVGTTGNNQAVSSGVSVEPLRSEISNNYDFSLRYNNKKFGASVTGFFVDYGDTIVRQTLILPPITPGFQLGGQPVTQISTGAVFVPISTSPVLVQANFGNTRIKGVEADFEYRFTDSWTAAGNYSYVYAADKATGAVPNLGGGGLPPALGFGRLRYQPSGKKYWVEGYVNAAGRQSRLSTLDLGDRRTGATRSRSQIQNFFQRGACVRGITTPGVTGCGSAGGMLVATGETLAQVQARMLPGVDLTDTVTAVPLFAAIPGYALFNLRGGYRLSDKQLLSVDLENIADKSHRAPGWGIDGAGRSFTVRYQLKF